MENVQSENNVEENKAALNIDHKCTVCHKSYCEPKLLPCGHLMCRKCLLSWLKQTRRATCPYCRYPILKDDEDRQATPVSQCKGDNPTEGDHNSTDIDDEELQVLVDSFPTELWMAALVRAEKLLREKQKCHVCDEQATSICLQCGDILCGSCKILHTKFTMLSHHTVEELSNLTAERLADFQPPTPCPQHPHEQCRIFCTQHAASLCVLCALPGHKDCPQITEFSQIEQDKAKLADLIQVMTNSSANIDGALSELDKHLADTEQRTKITLAEIQILKERLNLAVDKCCQRLQQQVSAAQENIREAVKEAKVILLGRQSRLTTHTALAQRVHASSARDVVCGMTSVMKTRLNALEQQLEIPHGSKIITKATLFKDITAAFRVEEELAKLGNAYEVFHRNHGKDIILSNGDITAKRTPGNGYNVVAVRKPAAVGDLIEVQIDLWENKDFILSECLGLGITQTSPDSDKINLLQQSGLKKFPKSAVITTDGGYRGGFYYEQDLVRQLRSLKQGSRMGVFLDDNRDCHLYVDGRDCGVFAQRVAEPYYIIFNLSANTRQVTLLPRRKIGM